MRACQAGEVFPVAAGGLESLEPLEAQPRTAVWGVAAGRGASVGDVVPSVKAPQGQQVDSAESEQHGGERGVISEQRYRQRRQRGELQRRPKQVRTHRLRQGVPAQDELAERHRVAIGEKSRRQRLQVAQQCAGFVTPEPGLGSPQERLGGSSQDGGERHGPEQPQAQRPQRSRLRRGQRRIDQTADEYREQHRRHRQQQADQRQSASVPHAGASRRASA